MSVFVIDFWLFLLRVLKILLKKSVEVFLFVEDCVIFESVSRIVMLNCLCLFLFVLRYLLVLVFLIVREIELEIFLFFFFE